MARSKWIRRKWERFEKSFVKIVCTYAPTATAPPGMRSKDLQDTLDSVP